MSKEEVLSELNNFASLIPENISNENKSEKLKRSIAISKEIIQTEEDLRKALNNAENVDEATSINLNDKKLDLQAAEKALRRSKLDSQANLNVLSDFELEVISPDESELNSLLEANKKDEEKGISSQERNEKIQKLQINIEKGREVLEKYKKNHSKYEEYIHACEEKVENAKNELKKVEDEISNKTNLPERTLLENRLVALNQIKVMLDSNPYKNLKKVISDYESEKINESEVKEGLSVLLNDFTFPNLDKPREKELEEISIAKQRLEKEIEELEIISNYNNNFNSGVAMPLENFYRIESQKKKFQDKVDELKAEERKELEVIWLNSAKIHENDKKIIEIEEKKSKFEEQLKVINSNINVNPKIFSESLDESGIKYGSSKDFIINDQKIKDLEFERSTRETQMQGRGDVNSAELQEVVSRIDERKAELTGLYNSKKNEFDLNRRRNNRQSKLLENKIKSINNEVGELKLQNQALELDNNKININSNIRVSNIEKYEALINRSVNNYKSEDLLPKKKQEMEALKLRETFLKESVYEKLNNIIGKLGEVKENTIKPLANVLNNERGSIDFSKDKNEIKEKDEDKTLIPILPKNENKSNDKNLPVPISEFRNTTKKEKDNLDENNKKWWPYIKENWPVVVKTIALVAAISITIVGLVQIINSKLQDLNPELIDISVNKPKIEQVIENDSIYPEWVNGTDANTNETETPKETSTPTPSETPVAPIPTINPTPEQTPIVTPTPTPTVNPTPTEKSEDYVVEEPQNDKPSGGVLVDNNTPGSEAAGKDETTLINSDGTATTVVDIDGKTAVVTMPNIADAKSNGNGTATVTIDGDTEEAIEEELAKATGAFENQPPIGNEQNINDMPASEDKEKAQEAIDSTKLLELDLLNGTNFSGLNPNLTQIDFNENPGLGR